MASPFPPSRPYPPCPACRRHRPPARVRSPACAPPRPTRGGRWRRPWRRPAASAPGVRSGSASSDHLRADDLLQLGHTLREIGEQAVVLGIVVVESRLALEQGREVATTDQ